MNAKPVSTFFCVTAENPLTHMREAVTPPCSRRKAMSVYRREKGKPPEQRLWRNLRLEPYPPQLNTLVFND